MENVIINDDYKRIYYSNANEKQDQGFRNNTG